MNSKFSLAVFAAVLLVCSFAHGQGATASAAPIAVNQLGVPIGSTLVTICTTNPGTGTCPTKVTLYTDNTLTTACSGSGALLNNLSAPSVGSGCSNPGFSDNLGNVVAFSSAGTAWCQYSGATITTYTQPCFFGGSSGGISGLTPGVIPQGGGVSGITNSSPQLDNGVTTTNQLTYAGQAFKIPADGVHATGLFLGGNTTPPPNLPSNSSGWIGPNSASFTSHFPQLPSASPTANQSLLCDAPATNIEPCMWVSQKFELITSYGGSFALQGFNQNTIGTTLGTITNNNPGVTDDWSRTFTSSNTASTSVVLAFWQGQGGSSSIYSLGAFQRLTFRFAIGNTTNARYWLGFCTWNTGSGAGNNGTQCNSGTSGYAADSPNKTTIGFRFSATTDTHWQAVTCVGGGSQTTVDTGITPDTNPHFFTVVNTSNTSFGYYIDGLLVATITTNIPNPANGADSWGSLFFTGDNKNTATAVSATLYYIQMFSR